MLSLPTTTQNMLTQNTMAPAPYIPPDAFLVQTPGQTVPAAIPTHGIASIVAKHFWLAVMLISLPVMTFGNPVECIR